MENFFVSLLFGHMVGDYLLQNKWMSEGKQTNSFRCFIHCLVYTFCVCLFTANIEIWWVLLIFASHYPIDRYSVADRWLNLINGRSLTSYYKDGDMHVPNNPDVAVTSTVNLEQRMNYRILRGGFTTLIYAAVDNTMHLLIMYYGYMLLS